MTKRASELAEVRRVVALSSTLDDVIVRFGAPDRLWNQEKWDELKPQLDAAEKRIREKYPDARFGRPRRQARWEQRFETIVITVSEAVDGRLTLSFRPRAAGQGRT